MQNFDNKPQGVGTLHRGCSCNVFECEQEGVHPVRVPPGIQLSAQEEERILELHRWYASLSGMPSSYLFMLEYSSECSNILQVHQRNKTPISEWYDNFQTAAISISFVR